MSIATVSEVSGERVFVVGDIHGCPDETNALLSHLEQQEGLSAGDATVFLGDYIDRGPDSKTVVDLLIDYASRYPRARFLKGNHEDMLLHFLGFRGTMGDAFLYNGGLETLQSYGVSVFSPPEEIVNALPESHFEFYNGLHGILTSGNYLFVHAGLHPQNDLNSQHDEDIYWIRDDFINHVHPFPYTVVFGHTPHQEILTHFPYKIGLDTGLVFGNKLTCLEVKSGKVFQVRRGSTEVEVSAINMAEAFAA